MSPPKAFAWQERFEPREGIERAGAHAVAIGVTRGGSPIWMGTSPSRPSLDADARRLVIVAGLSGRDRGTDAALTILKASLESPTLRDWDVAVIPLVCPDAAADTSGTKPSGPTFPPEPAAYQSATHPEGQYLWRRLAIEGADAVIEIREGNHEQWFGPGTDHPLAAGELAAAAATNRIADIGQIPGWRFEITAEGLASLDAFSKAWQKLAPVGESSARKTLRSRAARSPLEVARSLEKHYGHKLEPVEYLQGTAVLARLRLARLIGDADMENDAIRIAAQWLDKPTLDEKSTGSNFAGHLLFAELARTTDDKRYIEPVKRVADRGFTADGKPLEAMPTHSEMSDAVFMSTPMLVEAGKLTGETKYYELALKHLRFMLKLNLRPDGLHRHSPLDETAWGRGNGFPALGLALCLDQIPESRPERQEMLDAYRDHLRALSRWQGPTGMWHQVIDHHESYAELTSTCMITYAMIRGIRQGWLEPAEFEPAIERAWAAIKLRVGDDGGLVDVCTGTGKQKSLRDYLDRQALLGKDNRGGAMAMLVATQYADWKDELADQRVGKRVPWTSSRLVGSPDPPAPYLITNAFPTLDFDKPTSIHAVPDREGVKPNRMLVLQEDGKILTFLADKPQPRAEPIADFSNTPPPQSGMTPDDSKRVAVYSLAFHPDFQENRRVVICYIVSKGARRPDGTHIASFELSQSDPPQIDLASEKTIMTFDSGGHNGCTVLFGPDRMLYISTGDATSPSPPDIFKHGQNLGDIYSDILRIDADHPSEGLGYSIPQDNPFVNLPGARGEIFAYGFRNPWRMSFDAQTGDLWVGDVGWESWEMIYRVRPGGNYGWPIKEGPGNVRSDIPRGPTPILPADVALSHADAASITGGVVYHGQKLPELRGQYVFGDWITRRFWAAKFDSQRVLDYREIAIGNVKPVSFELDHQGELLILDYNSGGRSGIYRLQPNPVRQADAEFPRKLSQTGLFTSLQPLLPAPGVVPYSIAAPMHRDAAAAEYWLALPGDEPITFFADRQPTFDWFRSGVLFPEGTVIAKTYSLPTQQPGDSPRRIETQVAQAVARGQWNHYTYRWNAAGNEADLVDGNGEFGVMLETNGQPKRWDFASRSQCRTCHTPWRGETLGLTEAQLQGDPQGSWQRLLDGGWIRVDKPRSTEIAADAARLVDPHDTDQPIELRARSYLHANCAHCHLEGGNASVAIDVSFDKPLAATGLIDTKPMRGDFGIDAARVIAPGDPARSTLLYRIAKLGSGRMPALGVHDVDAAGVALLARWTAGLSPLPPPTADDKAAPNPTASDEDEANRIAAAKVATTECLNKIAAANDDQQRQAAIDELLRSTSGALGLLSASIAGTIDPDDFDLTVKRAANASPDVAELFEPFLPASQRVKRLGSGFDRKLVLDLQGDLDAGRAHFRDGIGQCSRCHLLEGVGVNVGPDLSKIGAKYAQPQDVLKHLVEPSAEIAEPYRAIQVVTDSGRSFTGVLISRDDQRLKLRDANGTLLDLPLDEITDEKAVTQSLMPENLIDGLTARQAADLVAYLMSLK